MNKGEPPSCTAPESPLFLVGKDSHGCWVVQDKSGLRGGLFVDRAEALKFAMFENGHRPEAVIMVPGVLELNIAPRPLSPAAPEPTRWSHFGRPHSAANHYHQTVVHHETDKVDSGRRADYRCNDRSCSLLQAATHPRWGF